MEKIEVNGKKYVLEEDYNELKRKSTFESPKFHLLSKDVLLDEANVLGIGCVQVGEGFHSVRLSVEYLEKIVKLLKQFSLRSKGLEKIDIVWTKDYPCIIGRLGKENKVSGFILAPVIEPE